MTDRPTEPGFYQRDELKILVYRDGSNRLRYDALNSYGHCVTDHASSLPTGNWQKLGERVTREEAREEFGKRLDERLALAPVTRDIIAEDAAEIFAGVPQEQPEVIIGKGQATESEVACYMDEWPDGCIQLVRFGLDSIFKAGHRYMRCPTFPPRKPAFVAPPKPEFALVRWNATGNVEWHCYSSNLVQSVERGTLVIIDPTTGEPIEGRA